MNRKLTDALAEMVEAGLLPVADAAEIVLMREVHICVSAAESQLGIRDKVLPKIERFQRLAEKYHFPTHNAVAFFSQMLETDLPTGSTSEGRELQELLLLALAGQGFLFGTTFDCENDCRSIRPCQTSLTTYIDHLGCYRDSLYSQATLKTAPTFAFDYEVCKGEVAVPAEEQRELVANWLREERTPAVDGDTAFKPTVSDLWKFLKIYSDYCTRQLEEDYEYALGTHGKAGGLQKGNLHSMAAKPDEVSEELQEVKKTFRLFVHLDFFYNAFLHLRDIEDREEHIQKKDRLIKQFLHFLRRTWVSDAIESQKDETYCMPGFGLQRFIEIAKRGDPSKARTTECWLLNAVITKPMKRDEKELLGDYQKHPMYRCYKQIVKALSNPQIAEAAPYFLTTWFVHRLNPWGPFKQKTHPSIVTAKQVEIADKVIVEKDPRVHHYRKCAYAFLGDLCTLFQEMALRHPEMKPCNKKLCYALFTRSRNVTVKPEWARYGPSVPRNLDGKDDLFILLYQRLESIFGFEGFPFPLYAKTLSRPDLVASYFFNRQDKNRIKAEKRINQLIKTEDAERYKKIVFLAKDGFGSGGMLPLAIHQELAEWLESIIRRDQFLQEYVVGDPNPYYPGTSMRLSTINDTITMFNEKDKTYPEDLQPYLAFVEWHIQKTCCKKVAQDMHQKVLGLYKRTFLAI